MGHTTTRAAYWLLGATFLSTLPATASLAQEVQGDNAGKGSTRPNDASDIIVTGSRIIRNGYNSPTPITVATTEQLIKAAPTNLPDALNQLPQFLNSGGPTRGNPQTVNSGAHGNLLNLRGVGPQRTLILLDGMRLPPTTYAGSVDTNIVPQLLIQRVDIVTAGVSAVYGSDAVAGVVNFVLNDKFEGLRAVGQQGITSRGDGRNYRIGVAGGFALGEKAHLLLSLEHYKSKGFSTDARPKNHGPYFAIGSTGVGAPGSESNPFKIASDVRWLLGTEGGVALSGPFALTNFVAPDRYRPINLGTPTGTPNFFIGGDAFAAPPGQTAARDLTTAQAFGRLTYDLTENVKAYTQFIGSQSRTSYATLPNIAFFSTILSGNAFLPAELQAQLTAANTPGFAFSHSYSAEGNALARERTRFYMGATGLQGQIGSKLTWDLSYNYGHSQHVVKQDNSWEVRRYAAAIDAVDEGVFRTGTANGNIVCRVTLTNPDVFPGCVPFNPFGPGASSAQARAFVDQGTPEYRAVISQHNVEGAITGEPFELWAGPVSTSLGASYRQSKLTLAGNGDPSVDYNVPGVRGIPATQTRWMGTLNVGHANGSQSVKEAFAEVVIPLLKDVPLVQSMDISGAARFTDYKTSGSVWTWKVGGTWRPVDDILFRATYSRDIRAPTLFDLYAGQSSALAQVFDPHTNTSGPSQTISGGNIDLRPEVSNTLSVGASLKPRFLSGLSMSIDYFDLKIEGAIGSLTTPTILDRCEVSGGTSPICALIERPLPFSDRTAANRYTLVRSVPINIAGQRVKGIDFDLSYRSTLGGGVFGARLYASYVPTYSRRDTPLSPSYNYAGYTGDGGHPKWKGLLSLDYNIGGFSVFVQEQYIDSLRYGDETPIANFIPGSTGSVFYTDITLAQKIAIGSTSEQNVELFVTINNLFDRDPPLFPGISIPGTFINTVQNQYDLLGRRFTVGARLAL